MPGGGQNDLWHQLQCKGKHAGEIRIELTYYDTRPQNETVLARRREKEKKQQSLNSAQLSTTGSRQLGPREIRRRPLPANPGSGLNTGVSTPEATLSTSNSPQQTAHVLSTPPNPPPQSRADEAYQVDRQYTLDLPQDCQLSNDRPNQLSHEEYRQIERDNRLFANPQGFPNPEVQSNHTPSMPGHPQFDYGSPREAELPTRGTFSEYSQHWADLPSTPQSDNSSLSSVNGSPQPAQSPISISNSSRPSPPHFRHSISPTKSNVYRDSPLRQSMSHYDLPEDTPPSPLHQAPPTPPTHATLPYRLHHPATLPESGQMPPASVPYNGPPTKPWRQSSWDECSPLQTTGNNSTFKFDHLVTSRFSEPLTPITNNIPSAVRRSSGDGTYRFSQRPNSSRENFPPGLWQGSLDEMKRTEEPDSYDSTTQYTFGEGKTLASESYSFQNRGRNSYPEPLISQEQVYRSQPKIYRPRAISPNAHDTSHRKSLGLELPPNAGTPLTCGAPFNPDAYEELNPRFSPSSPKDFSNYEFSDAREAARQREVEKLRDQQPIIGNDGRVIDPSDHLPSDTWAPEPERKTRKPEHVIRIRTREDPSRQVNKSFPPAPQKQFQFHAATRAAANEGDFSPSNKHNEHNGPNKLQKNPRHRPLPAQPVQHSQSTPNIRTYQSRSAGNSPLESPRPAFPPQSHYSTPSTHPDADHPAMRVSIHSDFPSFDYSRSSPTEHNYQPDFERGLTNHSEHFDYSSIDIGPSRYGRNGVRASREYIP